VDLSVSKDGMGGNSLGVGRVLLPPALIHKSGTLALACAAGHRLPILRGSVLG
jgi:hypothetical protein